MSAIKTKNYPSQHSSSFKVFIRIRPYNQQELTLNCSQDSLAYNQSQISLKIKNDTQRFTFDQIYHPQTTQQQIFYSVADDIIDNAFIGINGTIFCYGQTSSGKTHTLVGDYKTEFSQDQGLLPRILRQIIQRKNAKIQNINQSILDIRIKISMVQIYNEKVMDLLDLSKRDLKLRENKKQGVFIEFATQKYIFNVQEAMDYVKLGLQNRTVGRTNMNEYSSRSHMIFIITIHQTNFRTREAKSAKITLTDLAGNEKISKTGVQGKMLIEAKKINTSLSTLGKVIQALSESKISHVPYRDSKLTRILQESIGGNSLTRLIINISPSSINQYETITSLRFGSRAKLIKNKPKVNRQYTVEQLLILLEKAEVKIKQQTKIIEQLKQEHSNHRIGEYSGLKDYDKSITMHMIDDNYDNYDNFSSNENKSFVKTIASNQDKYNVSIFGDGEIIFKQTQDFNFQTLSPKKKIRKPTLSYSKSLKVFPTSNPSHEDLNQLVQGTNEYSQKTKKSQKSVRIVDNKDSDDDSLKDMMNNNTISEENESIIEEPLKNDVDINFQLPCNEIINQKEKYEFNWQKDHNQNKLKEDDNYLKQQIRDQLRQQLSEQIKQQIEEKLRQEFRQQIFRLEQKIKVIKVDLLQANMKVDKTQFIYQQKLALIEQQKQTIKAKDKYIVQLKQKYKAKKSQINKEINKLKIVWQSTS